MINYILILAIVLLAFKIIHDIFVQVVDTKEEKHMSSINSQQWKLTQLAIMSLIETMPSYEDHKRMVKNANMNIPEKHVILQFIKLICEAISMPATAKETLHKKLNIDRTMHETDRMLYLLLDEAMTDLRKN